MIVENTPESGNKKGSTTQGVTDRISERTTSGGIAEVTNRKKEGRPNGYSEEPTAIIPGHLCFDGAEKYSFMVHFGPFRG